MNDLPAQTHELLRIRVHGGPRFVGVAAAAVSGVARVLDFGDDDSERVRSVVDALCREVVTHHFDDPREADFTVVLHEVHGTLNVRIEDKGLPYPVDRFSLDDESLVGRLHAHGGADTIRLESRGIAGNSIELCVRQSPHHQTHLAEQADPGTEPVDVDAPITVRPLTSQDAPALARCVYRCYGYTYASDFIYYPDQVLSLIERNLLRSLVGVNPQAEVVGHCGIIRAHAESRVGESGMAVVDPRYRNHHVLGSLKRGLNEPIRELGLIGTYADAVTVHTITQKANADIGAVETGVLVAGIPAFTTFRGFDREPRQRGSVVMYYHPVGEAEARDLFLPARYRAVLESIYARLRLRRALREPTPGDAPEVSAIHVEMQARRGLARISVDRAGRDIAAQVTHRLRELCLHRFDVIHLDLRLGDAAAAAAVDDFAELGFFFGCAIPEIWQGDVLRLQYLNNVEIDPARIVLYSDEAKRLLHGILAEWR